MKLTCSLTHFTYFSSLARGFTLFFTGFRLRLASYIIISYAYFFCYFFCLTLRLVFNFFFSLFSPSIGLSLWPVLNFLFFFQYQYIIFILYQVKLCFWGLTDGLFIWERAIIIIQQIYSYISKASSWWSSHHQTLSRVDL